MQINSSLHLMQVSPTLEEEIIEKGRSVDTSVPENREVITRKSGRVLRKKQLGMLVFFPPSIYLIIMYHIYYVMTIVIAGVIILMLYCIHCICSNYNRV